MAIVRYDKRILKRLKRHTLFIISPPPSMEQYNVTLQRAKEKITAFYTEIEKYLSDDAFGGRLVPYNITNKEKYKYLVYTDIYSKVRWGVIYEDMGETRIVRILEQETFLASRFQIKENKVLISEADLLYMISESITRILRERYEDNPVFGWDYSKEWFLKGGADNKTIEKLHSAYDKFGEECAQKGKSPNAIGFDIWRAKKDIESCDKGKGVRYPDYL